jgi:hypothetical protein
MTLIVKLIHEDGFSWHSIEGKDCEITIEARPYYCDRGKYLAKLHPRGKLAYEIDEADGWPRYFFDWERMLKELEAWLTKRGQLNG